MADLETGATSTRVDLNLNLTPPWDSNIIGQNLSIREEVYRDDSLRHLPPNSLPLLSTNIHGLYLDLLQENDMLPGQSVLADGRGSSPSLSSMSHDQAVHTSVHEPTSGLYQETVEHFLEQAREWSQVRTDILDASRETETLQPMPLEVPHSFRRHSHPPQVAAGTIENISDQSLLCNRLVDVKGEILKAESSDSGKGAESHIAVNYECNICLEMAADPVLTCCGHLFCWPCLYQWLYMHSENDECPVCKGAVTERDIIPIYGRGNASGSARDSYLDGVGIVPCRPRARETESIRQRLHMREFTAEEERENARNYMWRFNEALRLRSFHFRPEVRHQVRAPSAESLPRPEVEATHDRGYFQPETVVNVEEAFQGRAEFISEHLQEDLIRRLAMNTSEIEDRLAAIRARLTSLSGEVHLHRTISAALSLSGILSPSVTQADSPRGNLQDGPGVSMLEEVVPSQGVETIEIENQDTSDVLFGSERVGILTPQRRDAPDITASECADGDGESSHGMKRRRLN